MACCSGIIKYFLFVFNILFWIAGGIVLGVGIYIRVSDNVSMVITFGGLNFYYAGSYILMSAGAIMFVVGFFGCCGAIKESRCLLIMYFTCLIVIFILEVGIGIWALTNQDSFEDVMTQTLEDQTPITYTDTPGSYSNSVVATEENFKCCGLTAGCSDWQQGTAYGCGCETTTSGDAKCELPPPGCKADPLYPQSPFIYTESCYHAVYDFIIQNLNIIAGVGLGIGLAEIFGMIFSMIMICDKKKDYDSY